MPTMILDLGDSAVDVRFKETYTSRGLNKKFAPLIGSGVVRGGRILTAGSGLLVTVTPDALEGDSVYSYRDASGLQFTVRQGAPQNLNLAAVASTTVYVCLYVGYTIGSTTVCEYRTYSEAELFGGGPVAEAAYVVILAKVVVPASGPIPAANITPEHRRLAWDDSPHGKWHQVVDNGDFEIGVAAGASGEHGIDSWFGAASGTPSFRVSTSAPYSGTRELELQQASPSAVNTRFLTQTKLLRVDPGMYVRGRYRMRGATALATTQGMFLLFYTNDMAAVGSPVPVIASALSGTFAYTLVDKIVAVPATAAWMRVAVGLDNAGASLAAGSLFFDDVHAWVESEHPLEDWDGLQDVVAEQRGFTPNLIDVASSMADFVGRTAFFRKLAQVAGATTVDQLKLAMKNGNVLRLLVPQLYVDQQLNDQVPRIVTTFGPSGWTLLWEVPRVSAMLLSSVRVYAQHNMIAIVIGATYDPVTDDWTREASNGNTATMFKIIGHNFFSESMIRISYAPLGSTTWADSDWNGLSMERFRFENVDRIFRLIGDGSGIATPGLIAEDRGTGITGFAPEPNGYYGRNVTKMAGVVRVVAGVPSVLFAHNFATATITGSGEIQMNLLTALDSPGNEEACIVGGMSNTGGLGGAGETVEGVQVSDSQIRLQVRNGASLVNLLGNDRQVCFVMLGYNIG